MPPWERSSRDTSARHWLPRVEREAEFGNKIAEYFVQQVWRYSTLCLY